jgi:hypothetical protein
MTSEFRKAIHRTVKPGNREGILLAVVRWLKWFVPQPPGHASIFVRTQYLPIVSETLTESVLQIHYGIAVSI